MIVDESWILKQRHQATILWKKNPPTLTDNNDTDDLRLFGT